jgi:hypothetical protein
MRKLGKIPCEKLSQVLKLVWCFLGRDSTCFGQVVDCEQEFLAHPPKFPDKGALLVG